MSPDRIVLGEDDFNDPPPSAGPAGPPPPSALPPVARTAPIAVGASALPGKLGAGSPSLVRNPRTGALLAAAIGMGLAWAISEVLGLSDLDFGGDQESDFHKAAAVWVGVVAVVYAAVVSAFDRAVDGAYEEAGRRASRAVVPAFFIGAIAGYIASAVYVAILKEITYEDFASGDADFQVYLARTLGWAVFGLGVGAVMGLLDGSSKKATNYALGGLLGGAAGGLAFEFSARQVESNEASRLIGLLAIGLLIALAVRVVETARREAWLSVLAGGMAGKEFIVYHAITRVGSSPDCEIFLLKDPAVAPVHAQIENRGNQRVISAAGGAPVLINETPVTTHILRNGDRIQIGSTVIGYAERALAAPVG